MFRKLLFTPNYLTKRVLFIFNHFIATYTTNDPFCAQNPLFPTAIESTCDAQNNYKAGDVCTETCADVIELTCDCLLSNGIGTVNFT